MESLKLGKMPHKARPLTDKLDNFKDKKVFFFTNGSVDILIRNNNVIFNEMGISFILLIIFPQV
jgi:hypothetical protein